MKTDEQVQTISAALEAEVGDKLSQGVLDGKLMPSLHINKIDTVENTPC